VERLFTLRCQPFQAVSVLDAPDTSSTSAQKKVLSKAA
jgi:hypothetical protein